MAARCKIFCGPAPAAVAAIVRNPILTGSDVADDCIDHIIDELSGNPVLTHGGTVGSARYVGADFVPPTGGISSQDLLAFPRPLITPPAGYDGPEMLLSRKRGQSHRVLPHPR